MVHTRWPRIVPCLVLALLARHAHADADADADAQPQAHNQAQAKRLRLKTTRQLKLILDHSEIQYDTAAKRDELLRIAAQHRALDAYDDAYPPSKRAPPPPSPPPDAGLGDTPPGGMDAEAWARPKAQMRGDFSGIKDPRKRAILERLKKSGLSFHGAGDMDVAMLEKLEQSMGRGTFASGKGDTPAARTEDEDGEEEVLDLDAKDEV